jgi:hypothetical protein
LLGWSGGIMDAEELVEDFVEFAGVLGIEADVAVASG